MKDKTDTSFQKLVDDIINFNPSRRQYLVFSGNGRKRFRVSQKMLNSDVFLNSDLHQRILDATKFLDAVADISLNDRIVAILKGIHEIPICPVCEKNPCRFIKRQRSLISKPMFTDFCSSSCQATYASNNRGETTELTRRLMHESAIRSKSNLLEDFKTLISDVNCEHFDYDISEVKHFCIDHVTKNRCIVADDLRCNKKILVGILRLTEFIFIPDLSAIRSKTDFKFNERMYCIANRIYETVRCQFCGKNPVKFINMKRGYSDVCSSVICMSDKNRKQKGLMTSKDIISKIESTGHYTVLNFPENIERDYLVTQCNKCGTISKRKLFCGRGQQIDQLHLCDICDKYVSNEERELRKMIGELIGNDMMTFQDRDIISPLELDIVVKDCNLAVEFDGFYWHNQHAVKKQYHQMKTVKCYNAGYNLIHVFNDEIIHKKDLISEEMRRIFNINLKMINAGDCHIKLIDQKTFRDFASENCILDQDQLWSDYYALMKDNSIFAVAAIKRSKSLNIDIEMSLVIEKCGCLVVNAVNRFTEFFETQLHMKSIIMHINNRWPTFAQKYIDSGFTFQRLSKYAPNFYYTGTNAPKCLTLRQFKAMVKNDLGEYSDIFECAADKRYEIIYDCGTLVLTRQLKG